MGSSASSLSTLLSNLPEQICLSTGDEHNTVHSHIEEQLESSSFREWDNLSQCIRAEACAKQCNNCDFSCSLGPPTYEIYSSFSEDI